MSPIESLIFLLGAAALLAQLARFLSVPYPVFLVLGGLLIGFVPGLPTVEISPEVIFLVFLPPLLNYAAFFSSPRDLRRHLRPLLALAVGLVLFTTAAIALIAHALIGLPWAAAFVLGAILAPTDPVAAEAIFRRLGVPGRVSTIVGGESFVNDGTGLVAYRLAVAAVVTGTFSVWEAGLDFLLVGGGGIILGLILAWVILPLWKRVRDPSKASEGPLYLHRPLGAYALRCLRAGRGDTARLWHPGRAVLRPLPRVERPEFLPQRLHAHTKHLLLEHAGLPPGVSALRPGRPTDARHPPRP
jgi:NhaP-type Na+/H+ or K+/H+ antiporter